MRAGGFVNVHLGNRERFQSFQEVSANFGIEAMAGFTGEQEAAVFVIADEEEFKAGGIGPIAADDEFLFWFERKFLPVGAAAAGFVN